MCISRLSAIHPSVGDNRSHQQGASQILAPPAVPMYLDRLLDAPCVRLILSTSTRSKSQIHVVLPEMHMRRIPGQDSPHVHLGLRIISISLQVNSIDQGLMPGDNQRAG